MKKREKKQSYLMRGKETSKSDGLAENEIIYDNHLGLPRYNRHPGGCELTETATRLR
jgi:hypothetical protein